MKTSRPPVVATWLLEHLLLGRGSESITGDLIEQWQGGRSRAWYWRQVLAAVLVSFCKEINGHPFITIRAAATGWALLLFQQSFWFRLVGGSWLFPVPDISPRLMEFFGHYFVALHMRILLFRLDANQDVGLRWWIVLFSFWTGSGWIVAKTNRVHRRAMVLVCSVSVLLWMLQGLPWAYRLFSDTIHDARYSSYLVAHLMNMFLPSVSIVLGGLLAGQPRSDLSAHKVGIAT